jgi:hypothetical protein
MEFRHINVVLGLTIADEGNAEDDSLFIFKEIGKNTWKRMELHTMKAD